MTAERRKKPPIHYFQSKYRILDSDCWLWIGMKTTSGYGRFKTPGHSYAHRFSYSHFNGPIPNGLHVCHTCDNKLCVNPSHLWVGTPKDNHIDSVKKGRNRPPPPTNWEDIMKAQRHHWQKLNREDIPEIRKMLEQGIKQATIAKKYNVAVNTIGNISQGIRWVHVR